MAKKKNKKVIRYRRPLNINVGMIIFAIIFLYLISSVSKPGILFPQAQILFHSSSSSLHSINPLYASVWPERPAVMLIPAVRRHTLRP